MSKATTVQVYTPDLSSVLTLTASSIVHWPTTGAGMPRPVLCRGFTRTSTCVRGDACKYVHADVDLKQAVVDSKCTHVNYAWTALKEVTYACLRPGNVVKAPEPNSHGAKKTSHPSEHVLKTRGSVQWLRHPERDAPSHCAHYRFNRVCNRGADCHFIHAVYIDPTAKPGQKAPAPVERGAVGVDDRPVSRNRPTAPRQGDENPLNTDISEYPIAPTDEGAPSTTARSPCRVDRLPMFRYDPYSSCASKVHVWV